MMSELAITLGYGSQSPPDLRVKLEIFDTKLEVLEERWTRVGDRAPRFTVSSGVYGIRALMPSGKSVEEVWEIGDDERKDVFLNVSHLSPHETHEWAYLSQNMGPSSCRLLYEKEFSGAWIRCWRRKGEKWELASIPIQSNSYWDKDGVSYALEVHRGLHVLQVGGPKIPWKIVTLPPSPQLLCLIRPAEGPRGVVHPLEVSVSSKNWAAETLLTFLAKGAMDRAHEMLKHDQEAEDLLLHKIIDPAAAAVGAYYLLRIGALERLHNWAEHLADWMEWMADGTVVRAWQLIKEAKKDRQRGLDQAEVRERLLEAVKRGFPIYTEGLRLLHEGLHLLHHESKGDDAEVAEALETVSLYATAADWSTATTTFLGATPEEPTVKSRKGTPHSRENLAFIYDVPLKEMIRQSVLAPGTELVLGDRSELPTFTVSEAGRLQTSEGVNFFSPAEAALAISEGKTTGGWEWKEARSKQKLEELIQRLRGDPEYQYQMREAE